MMLNDRLIPMIHFTFDVVHLIPLEGIYEDVLLLWKAMARKCQKKMKWSTGKKETPKNGMKIKLIYKCLLLSHLIWSIASSSALKSFSQMPSTCPLSVMMRSEEKEKKDHNKRRRSCCRRGIRNEPVNQHESEFARKKWMTMKVFIKEDSRSHWTSVACRSYIFRGRRGGGRWDLW